MLLSDIFQEFRGTCMLHYGLDPAQYLTLSSYSWDCMLKYTKVNLQLITDPEMYTMIESSLKGGVAGISHRRAEAHNKDLPGFVKDDESSYIVNLDANNLYGYSMSKPLPNGNFSFLTPAELNEFDYDNIDAEGALGYICEVDLYYNEVTCISDSEETKKLKQQATLLLHNKHNDYPLAPESLLITKDMLSPFFKSF